MRGLEMYKINLNMVVLEEGDWLYEWVEKEK